MSEKQQHILKNLALLSVAPTVIQTNEIFLGLTRGLSSIFEELANNFSEDKHNFGIDEELNGFVNEFLQQVRLSLSSLAIEFNQVISDKGLLELLSDAENKASILLKKQPKLPRLDQPLDSYQTIILTAMLNENDTRTVILAEMLSEFQPIFDIVQQRIDDQEKFEQSIFVGAGTGDIGIIEKYCDAGLDLFALNQDKRTALEIAIEYQQQQAIEYIIKRAAGVSVTTVVSQAALEMAIDKDNSEVFELLINYANGQTEHIDFHQIALSHLVFKKMTIVKFVLSKLDNIPDLLGKSAMDNNEYEKMQLLLTLGLDPNFKIYSSSAVSKAIDNNDLKMVELLAAAGAQLDTLDFSDRTALFRALEDDNAALVTILIQYGASIKAKSSRDLLEMIEKYSENNKKTIRETFLLLKVDAHFRKNERDSLLNLAVEKLDEELIAFLLESGVDINSLFSAKNILHEVNELSMVKLLIDKGLDIDFVIDGEPVIFDLLSKDQESLRQLLISNGINLDVKNDRNEHLLHYCTSRSPSFVKSILAAGVNPDTKNKDGLTCVQSTIHFYDSFEHSIIDFIDYGADFSLNTSKGFPIIHVLCASYSVQIVQKAKEKLGLDFSIKGKNGHNTFFHATACGNLKVLPILSDSSDKNEMSDAGITPLSLAIYRDDSNLLKILINDCKVDTNIKIFNRYSPKQLAEQLQHNSLVQYLPV